MAIYIEQDDGTKVPLFLETSVEELLKTRDKTCVASPCVQQNLNLLVMATESSPASDIDTSGDE